MQLFFKDNTTGSSYFFESTNSRAIIEELENSFYRNQELTEASAYDEIELVSCLLQTIVNSGKLEQSFKDYLVCNLRETKGELMRAEDRITKFYLYGQTPNQER